MKYKIGVFGSASNTASISDAKKSAQQIGQTLGEYAKDIVVITGACTGLPYLAAYEAAQKGAEVWGFSPVSNLEEQKIQTPEDDLSIYTQLIYVPKEFPHGTNRRICFKYRNVLSTAECDAGIIISGQWGSLNEFTNLVDMQKVAGILTGTGGIADELPSLCAKIKKDGQGQVIFNDDPKALVNELLALLKSQTLGSSD